LGDAPDQWLAVALRERGGPDAEALVNAIFEAALHGQMSGKIPDTAEYRASRAKILALMKKRRPQLKRALKQLEESVLDGLSHGTFDYSLTCRSDANGNRLLTIQAGKVYPFNIGAAEIAGTTGR
jgi:hypothetical protein